MVLSPREYEIVKMIAKGMEPGEIAAELGIGLKTFGTHRDRARQKLGCRNNVEICLWWQKSQEVEK